MLQREKLHLAYFWKRQIKQQGTCDVVTIYKQDIPCKEATKRLKS